MQALIAAANETLARLLTHGMEDVATAMQSEAKVDKVAELEAQLAAQSAQIQAILDRDNAKDKAAKDRMAKARAGRKSSQASAG